MASHFVPAGVFSFMDPDWSYMMNMSTGVCEVTVSVTGTSTVVTICSAFDPVAKQPPSGSFDLLVPPPCSNPTKSPPTPLDSPTPPLLKPGPPPAFAELPFAPVPLVEPRPEPFPPTEGEQAHPQMTGATIAENHHDLSFVDVT
jgi:hypothetical protein